MNKMRKFRIKAYIAAALIGCVVLYASTREMPVITIYNLF